MWKTNRSLTHRAVLAVVACAAALPACALPGSDDEVVTADSVATTAAPGDAAGTTASAPSQLASADETTTSSAAPDASATPAGGDGDAAVTCSLIDAETIGVELTNSTSSSASYWLTIGYYDGADQRLADTSIYVNYVRPGEHVVEESYVFEEEAAAAATCRVLEVDETPDDIDADLVAGVSACQITGEDFVGDVEANLSVSNSRDAMSDFSVTVAVVDSAGVRRGTGTGYVEAVAPGETAPADVFTTVDFDAGHTCEVVAVDAYDS